MSNTRTASRLGLLVVLLVAFVTCFVQPLSAQESRGTVRGVVSDPTHAVVPGAKVSLHNAANNVDLTTQADASGFYLFDRIVPATYSVVVEAAGFEKFVQENVVVQTAADITVNAVLTLGAVTQTVEVTSAVAQVEFNTSTMSDTVQQSFLKDLPILARNPFSLALLDAGVINDYWDEAHRLPFYMWSDGGLDIGGPTGGKNEQIIDGSRTDIAARGTYNAPMDAVQEVVVQQQIPDAEHGFSAGGAVNISMKSGSNGIHGDVYSMARRTWANAMANRYTRSQNVVHQTIWGGTVGHPIIKNKLFNFFAFEDWRATQPSNQYQTVPTAAERQGDFSGALISGGGAVRPIYDPLTTANCPSTLTPCRTQFSGNKIPASRVDPTATAVLPYLWWPNASPDDPDGANNFKVTYPWWTHYHNLSDRVDWNASDKLRMYAHYSLFRTRLDNVNWSAGYMNGGAPSIAVPSDNGGIMDATSSGFDALYMFNPKTTMDIRLGVNYEEDDYASTWATVPLSVWAGIWPNSNWYTCCAATPTGTYFPRLEWSGIGGSPYMGNSGGWYDHLRDYVPQIILTREMGKHHIKTGWQFRYAYSQNLESFGSGAQYMNAIDTEQNYIVGNAGLSGDAFASGLLGIMNSGNATAYPIVDQVHYQQWGFFLQDDYRLSPRTTLNLGVRWERETYPEDNNRWLVSKVNLNRSIPLWPSAFQLWSPGVLSKLNADAANPSMPPGSIAAASIIPTLINPTYTGVVERTTNANPRIGDAPWNLWLPRVGLAYKLNDKTALRVGYSRFAVTMVSNRSDESVDMDYNGFQQTTSALGPLAGLPQAYLSNPYPATSNPVTGQVANPIIQAVGFAMGPYQDLGNGWGYWDDRSYKTPINDRININIQRQLPAQFRFDGTLFMMFEHHAQDGSMWGGLYTYNVNQVNPEYSYRFKQLLDQPVPNPFYGAFPTTLAQAGVSQVDSSYLSNPNHLPIIPGTMGTAATTTVAQLLRPYPQFGDMNVIGPRHDKDHYYGLALSVTRPMAKGWTFLGTYNYSIQNHTQYYDNFAAYANQLTMYDRGLPRHNLRMSGTYQLPFGKGRQYLSNIPRMVDEVIGGWATSQIFYFMSGDLDGFGGYEYGGVICNPSQNIPAGLWFNPNCLINPPGYQRASSPPYFEGLRGPHYWQLDSTVSKYFHIAERFNLELRLELYNMPNHYIPSDPIISTFSGNVNAGKTIGPAGGSNGANYGRELQASARLHF